MKTAEQWQQGKSNIGGIELALVRKIQIDALRESREIAERAGDDDLGHAFVLHELDKLVRDLELK